ncbi:alpha/beta fold hydrolase [Gordonia sp. HNM0687]|uniref:Alpha/beta fold hydrolase n=1 Tax=Gordonia mangrovi TaxID=2665643 RepID=A0A6L7GRB2_9ACTN|nr:alpha/beta hydrolase [Gordonia mangrovi]MXP21225.1 alpha/beta fold hydrolase [Gordonia mangrovi]UVF78246.1 alpha/beta hydrolase [Gordonia mangrovi]
MTGLRPVLAAAFGAAGGAALLRYRRDISHAYARVEALDRLTAVTRFGAMEYLDHGAGEAILVSHGIFHGCDGGLRSVQDTIGTRRVIAPSRFGYLGSAMPRDASVADQADAFVELLDVLGLPTVDAIGISAGTSAAVQLALRHPDRLRHLIISSGSFPGSDTAQAPPEWAKLLYSDPPLWALKRLARPVFARMMGVPEGFPRGVDDARVLTQMLDTIFPVRPRVTGAVFDAYVANPDVNDYPLEELRVPTLIVHAADDPLASYEAARAAGERIPDARFVGLDSGGHLQLGQTQRVRTAVAAFLASGELGDTR